ncbi:MAG: hypothetical protein HY047_18625 [Acidobacteria bacterium]|nr:hypothetical protein [Acidobacteriota bacterium]
MGKRFLASLGVVTLGLAIAAAAPAPLQRQAAPGTAKAWTFPRTSWGDPDFAGLWNYATMTPLERLQAFATKETLTDAEAAAYERQTTERQAAANNTAGPDWWDEGTRHLTERRTSLIIDPPNGRLPPLTPEAQTRASARTQANRARGPADGPEDLGLNVRCILWSTAGPPMLPGVYNNNVQFIQTRDHVVIVNEMIHDARIIPMDGRAHGAVRRWMGDSRGRWDGQTLVVDTINFTEKSAFRGSGEGLHLVERFTRVGEDTIRYEFTAEDPGTWTRPWTAMIPLNKTEGPMLEYACHEGNERSMVGILRAARVQDPRQ